jgi:hypothetical protein
MEICTDMKWPAVPPSLQNNNPTIRKVFEDLQLTCASDSEIEDLRCTSASDIENVKSCVASMINEVNEFKELCSNTEPGIFDPTVHRASEYFQRRMYEGYQDDFKAIHTTSDGSCFYSAVSQVIFGTETQSDILRLSILQHIMEEEEKLRGIAGAFSTPFEKLVADTKVTAGGLEGWGTEFNIFIASEFLQRPIIVHSAGLTSQSKGFTQKFNSNPACVDKKPIHIMHMSGHFQPLMPRTKETPSIEPINTAYPHITHKYENTNNPSDQKQIDLTAEQLQALAEVQREDYLVIQAVERMERQKMKPTIWDPWGIKSAPPPALRRQKIYEESIEQKQSEDTRSRSPIRKEQSLDEASIDIAENPPLGTEENISDPALPTDVTSSGSSEYAPRQVKQIDKKIDRLTVMMSQIMNSQGKPTSTVVASTTQEIISSVDQLLERYSFLETRLVESTADFNDEFNEIICNLCFDPRDMTNLGKFTYHSSWGTDFQGLPQTERFRNVKKNIHKHSNSELHLKKSQEAANLSREQQKFVEKNRKAGMICGRLAYTAIKSDQSLSKYEEHVSLLAALKMPVGQLNHSRKFCRELGDSIYKCLRDRLESYIKAPIPSTGRPTPVSFIADKYTPNRITGQIVGIVAFVDGKIKDINIGFPKVVDPGAIGIAECLYGSLREFYSESELKSRYVKTFFKVCQSMNRFHFVGCNLHTFVY